MTVSDKPKILFVLHLPPPIHGAAMVGKTIYESNLVNDSFNCKYINLATASSLEDIGKFRLKKFSDILRLKKMVRQTVIDFQPDLVYLTPCAGGLAFFKDYLIVQMLKRMGKKLLLHFHNKGVQKYQNNIIFDFCYKRFFKDVNVMLLSSYLYPDMQRYLNEEQYHVCFNGIPEKETKHTEKKIDKEGTPNILFLSNLLVSKGIFVLIDACKQLKNKGVSFTCTIIGSETKEISAEELNNYIHSCGLNSEVNYVGKAYGEEKDAYLADADIFAFPTFNEAFPLVLLEAMQFGLPIISTPEGGIPDILIDSKNGLMCKQKDADSLAEALQCLIENPDLRHKMGACGKEMYLQKFKQTHFENQFVNVINTVLQQ